MTNHTDNYLPADTGEPITNPAQIVALIEADTAAQESQPMNTETSTPSTSPPSTLRDDVSALAMALTGAFMPIINRIVEKKFAQLVENHRTLALMDESMTARVVELINTRMEDHEREYDHDQIIETLTKDDVHDTIVEWMNDNLSDEVQTLLTNATVEITL